MSTALTVAEALRGGVSRLTAAGVPGALADGRLLLAYALGIPRHELTWAMARAMPDEALQHFDVAIRARATRQPVAQIIGHRAFWKHDFRVTRDTLDPRPETETLIEAALTEGFATVLDLGTGSGAILISLLAERPGTVGTGTDISPAALEVAKENAAMIGVSAQFIESDWFSALSGVFDLVVSNPPYIALNEMEDLSPDVRDWEPRRALTDEGDGLSAYRAITDDVAAHLAPGGRLLVEIGPTQAVQVTALMRKAGLGDLRVMSDLGGRDRVVSGRKPR